MRYINFVLIKEIFHWHHQSLTPFSRFRRHSSHKPISGMITNNFTVTYFYRFAYVFNTVSTVH